MKTVFLAAPACAILISLSVPAAAQGYGSDQQQQGGQPYGAPPASGGQPLQSGGLAPPSSQADPESARTEEELQKAETEDSGRGLEWFFVNAEIGAEHLGLQTFSANDKLVDASVVDTAETGLVVGAGIGFRLVFLTIGPRFRLASFSDYQLWTLDAELGLRIPLGSVEPYFTLAGGYASLGAFSSDGLAKSNVSVSGYDVRAGGGIDVYVTPVFSIGGSLTGELVGLTRPGVSLADAQKAANSQTPTNQASGSAKAEQLYRADGSSVGFGVTGTAVLGLHF